MGFAVIVLALAGIAVAAFFREHSTRKRAVILRRAGAGLVGFSSAFFAVFLAGETLGDPGGWEAAGLIAAWLVPVVALGLLAWRRPRWAVPVLGILTLAVAALSLWWALDPALRSLENRVGPLTAVAMLIVTIPLSILGWRRTVDAGIMLLTLGAAPALFSMLRVGGGGPPRMVFLVLGSPAIIGGALYLLSASVAGLPLHWSWRPGRKPPASHAA